MFLSRILKMVNLLIVLFLPILLAFLFLLVCGGIDLIDSSDYCLFFGINGCVLNVEPSCLQKKRGETEEKEREMEEKEREMEEKERREGG